MTGIYTRHSRRCLPLLLMLSLASLSGCKTLHDKLDAYLSAAHDHWSFSGSVLVAWKGNILLSEGYGLADQPFNIPNTPRTKFFIGSITKQFTAAAIMKLQEQKKLDIDDKIGEYLPGYPSPDADRITIRHLLNHTSGIPNYTDVPEVLLRRTTQLTPADLMSTFIGKPLNFEPGTDFEYSNSGYIVLGAIIERVSGQSYEAYLHHDIFKPAGMFSSGYARREMALPETATGYTQTEDGILVNAPLIHLSVLHTAGALYSTVEDMFKWDQALREFTVISEESVRQMLTPNQYGYGFGWIVDGLYGHRHTYHGGFLDGFNTTYERWVDDDVCIIVFSNDDAAPVKKIARGLAAILLGQPHDRPIKKRPIDLDPSRLTDFNGVFRADNGLLGFVTTVNDTLRLQLQGEPRQILLPERRDKFFTAVDHTVMIEFYRDDTGAVARMRISEEGLDQELNRLPGTVEDRIMGSRHDQPLDIGTLSEYTGLYQLHSTMRSTESGFFLVVTRWGNRLYAAAQGTDVVPLEPIADGTFVQGQGGFEITFTREKGIITGCVLRMNNAEISGIKIQ